MDVQGKIDRWCSRVDEVTQGFDDLFQKLDHDTINQRPEEGEWSVAEVMEHLILTSKSYVPELEKMNQKGYRPSSIMAAGFLRRWIEKTLIKSVDPERLKKVKTMQVWTPSRSDYSMGIFDDFKAEQEALKQRIKASTSLLKKNRLISSPANKNIVYSLEGAWEIVTLHELRHLKQAERTFVRVTNQDR